MIQLKKVLSLNPKLVRAHQLLALLYIRAEEYERAGRELRRALAIDRTDTLSLHYQAELEALTGKPLDRAQKGEKEKKKEEKNPDVISYTSGNETIIMPAAYKENTGVNVVLNIFIGLVIGVALMWFLALPAKIQSVRNEANEQIRGYSDQISAKQSEINSLQSQLAELQGTGGEGAEGSQAASGGSYERLAEAYAAFLAGDAEGAAEAVAEVDPEELSDAVKTMYYQVYGSVNADKVKELFDAGSAAYSAKNYAEAAVNLEQVVQVDREI